MAKTRTLTVFNINKHEKNILTGTTPLEKRLIGPLLNSAIARANEVRGHLTKLNFAYKN